MSTLVQGLSVTLVASLIKTKINLFLATGFGSGYFPKAPGTVGTAVAIIPWYFLQTLDLYYYSLVILVSSVAGIYICDQADKAMASHDNKRIVWDEFCGFWITMFAIPFSPSALIIGFVLFRFFDIVKPWPIKWIDRNVHGGVGVMSDDIVAGIISCLCLHLLYALI